MQEVNKNIFNEHTTIFNGLLYVGDSSESQQFREMNDLLKDKHADHSWKAKTKDERVLLKKAKSNWKSYVESLPLRDRPNF